tara:strand:- start:4156 stop:4455 length:300 start_codon:yes stop_codon:yes gene_type:complete
MKEKKPNKGVEALCPDLQSLLDSSKMIQESIEWWDRNIADIIDELDRLEELPWSPEIEKQIDYNQQKLRKFLKRGEMERKQVDDLEKRLHAFFISKTIN